MNANNEDVKKDYQTVAREYIDDDEKKEKLYQELNEKYGNKAKEYIEDKEKAEKLLKDSMKKAKNKGPLEEVWDYLMIIFSLIKDWINGEYREIPNGSIIAIMIGLIYFVSPVDIIPDFIPGIGLLDDAIVLGLIIKQVKADLDKYKEWKQARNK